MGISNAKRVLSFIKKHNTAEEFAAKGVLEELTDRQGFDYFWDACDGQVRAEIRREFISIIKEAFRQYAEDNQCSQSK